MKKGETSRIEDGGSFCSSDAYTSALWCVLSIGCTVIDSIRCILHCVSMMMWYTQICATTFGHSIIEFFKNLFTIFEQMQSDNLEH